MGMKPQTCLHVVRWDMRQGWLVGGSQGLAVSFAFNAECEVIGGVEFAKLDCLLLPKHHFLFFSINHLMIYSV